MKRRPPPSTFLRSIVWSLIPGTLLLGYNGCTTLLLRNDARRNPRNPATGIVIGCEAADLAPDKDSRRACLLLHGVVGSRKDFSDLGERLADHGFHVRLARLPGHGTTPDDFSNQTSTTLLASARQELAAMRKEFDEVNVIGFSMGGTLATLLAAEGQVDRLILVAPYYRVTHRWFYLLPAEKWNDTLAPAIPYVPKSSKFVQVNRPDAKKQLFSYHAISTRGTSALIDLGRTASQPENLAKIHCPTLLVMSEGDMAASPQAAREAFARIGSPEKSARWFTRSNHHLLWDWDADRAKQEIINFLQHPSQ